MHPAANIASATAYLAISARLLMVAWQVRAVISWQQLTIGLFGSALFLLSCAAHHVGHTLNAPWAPVATVACGIFSSAGALIIWCLGGPLARSIAQLIHGATEDQLTGLANRHTGFKVLNQWLNSNTETSLILIDIDHFKRLNDTYGHPHGDQVIKKTGQIIDNQIRQCDIAARWGGEEYLVILPGCRVRDALPIAQNILIAVRQQGNCTISAGVAQLSGDITESLKKVDKALYTAKKRGRNQVAI